MAENIEHHQLLRAMDAIVEHQDEADEVLAALMRPVVNRDLIVMFYDMTTIRAGGLSQQDDNVASSACPRRG